MRFSQQLSFVQLSHTETVTQVTKSLPVCDMHTVTLYNTESGWLLVISHG